MMNVPGLSRAPLVFPLVLFLFIWSSRAYDADCIFSQVVQPGKTYFVTNPGYPQPYYGFHNCIWRVRSAYRIRVRCNQFNIPSSTNCTRDSFVASINTNMRNRFCGNGTFTVESQIREMNITFTSTTFTSQGIFACALETVSPTLQTDGCRCGWSNPTRIVGGENAGVNEFPMMAGLVDMNARNIFCGATIISSKYVITAAHCFATSPVESTGCVVGEHDVTTGAETNVTRLFRLQRYIRHPAYIVGERMNDIGIVEVQGTIEFGNRIGPACLPFQHAFDSFAGDPSILLGWGTLESAGRRATILQKVTVGVIPRYECLRQYSNVTEEQICTFGENKDACQSDSGGPVLRQDLTTKQYIVIGVISYGRSCGTGAGVNTKVGAHIDWIASETSDATYCAME